MREQLRPLNAWVVLGTQLALTVLALALWEWGGRAGWVDRVFFSKPTDIGLQIGDWWRHGYIVEDVVATMSETIAGLIAGSFVGIVLGVLLASNRFLGAVFEPLLVLLNSIPRITLVPLFILWFGFSFSSKLVSAMALVLFVVFFATYAGIKDVDPTLVANVRVMGATRLDIVRHVLVPSALSWIFSSLRSAVGFALIGAVVAEYFGANVGVGYRIVNSEASYNTAGVFAGLVILMVLVVLVDTFIRWLQRRLIVWKPASL
jgi:NitT/TauT family transport system permease protein